MILELGFGASSQTLDVPDANLLSILRPNATARNMRGIAGSKHVHRAFMTPVGSPKLKDIVKPGEKIAVITSDITKPMPTHTVMPRLLEDLYAAGVSQKDITLVFALGTHRPHTEAEKKMLVGERIFEEINCIDSNGADCVRMGFTSRGTPVDITRVVAEADRRICLGNIEYHEFAGYSGGVKALMPGVASREAVQANHSLMVQANAAAGVLNGNPVREDMEEAAAICKIDFVVNVILDEHKKIIMAVGGDPVKAHRKGCKFLDALCKIPTAKRADIVVVSQGGAPKDMNLYQTVKALDNARHAVRKGGSIILVGSCKEGFGDRVFEEWLTTAGKPDDMIDRVKTGFELGGHRAAVLALLLKEADITLVSELDPQLVKNAFFKPSTSAQQALNNAFNRLGPKAGVIVMPYGSSTLPLI